MFLHFDQSWPSWSAVCHPWWVRGCRESSTSKRSVSSKWFRCGVWWPTPWAVGRKEVWSVGHFSGSKPRLLQALLGLATFCRTFCRLRRRTGYHLMSFKNRLFIDCWYFAVTRTLLLMTSSGGTAGGRGQRGSWSYWNHKGEGIHDVEWTLCIGKRCSSIN